MSLYVLPENQELIWKTISKVPQFQQMNNTQNEKHIWFRNVIQMFHEKTSPNIDVNQLRQLNKETIQFMMKDLKNQKTFQPLSEINNLGNHSLQPPFSNNQGSYIETNKTQTRDYMHEQKQMQLTDQFASKQKEYESFLQKPSAREINFQEKEQDDKPIENLEELVSTAERFTHNNLDSDNLIQDFLDNASLEAGEYQSKLDSDPLQLMTIHSAKGLEFPVVFLTGLDEGIFPNPNRDIVPGFLEEERRLCYVAITRAMQTLYLTCSNMRYMHGSSSDFIPSRFISEIPNELIEPIKTEFNKKFSNKSYIDNDYYNEYSQENTFDDISQDNVIPFIRIGQRVNHLKFGHGVVLSYTGKNDDLKVHVDFKKYGKKWLVLSYTQLEFIN